jgi:hypothetical protein
MSRRISQLSMVLALASLAGCASGPHSRPGATALVAPTPSRVVVTGSHIPVAVDARTGQPQAITPLQTVTQTDIERTGQTNLADALRMLLPSLR